VPESSIPRRIVHTQGGDYWIPARREPANSAFTRVCDALWPGSLGRGDIPRAIALPYRGMGARQLHRNTIEIVRGYLEIASRYYL
jgi:hypothetical protein